MSPLLKLLAIASCLTCLSASAAFQGYVRIEGVEGGSQVPGHEGWSDLHALESEGKRPAGAQYSEGSIRFVKPMDKASPLIFQYLTDNTTIPEITFDVFLVDDDGAHELWRVVLESSTLTSIKTEMKDGQLIETISVGYRRLSSTYYQIDGAQYTLLYDKFNQTSSTSEIPSSADPDGDGMPIAYEVDNGLDTDINDADEDKDQDGLTNYEEYIYGTRADTGSSAFTLNINGQTGAYELSWPAIPDRTYTVLYSADLTTPFSKLTALSSNSKGAMTYPIPGAIASGFFRIAVSE